jgi:hypothetical protein
MCIILPSQAYCYEDSSTMTNTYEERKDEDETHKNKGKVMRKLRRHLWELTSSGLTHTFISELKKERNDYNQNVIVSKGYITEYMFNMYEVRTLRNIYSV